METGNKLYDELKQWSLETFGKDKDIMGILDHLQEELDELRKAVENKNKGWESIEAVQEEYADMQLILWDLMSRLGNCYNRCMDFVAIKLQICKHREWEKAGESGMYKHKKLNEGGGE